ncbi:MAG: hypothetical protein HRF52_05890 [Ignavibacterium sp.]|jgi:DNA-binding transcriptional regulator YhcF (GntR family)|uniref:hypothetical protein n=1 Tax=Ignavibacterium sp. TaxID=2651167 RepID=UPI003298EEC9
MKELDKKKFFYTPCFEVIAKHYRHRQSKIYDKVFGIIYRYCQLNNGVCYASVRDTLAPRLGVTPKVFGKVLKELVEDGFIELQSRGNTNSYTVNIEKVEELLLQSEVVSTSLVEEELPQSEVETTSKERESLKDSIKEILSETSEGKSPSSSLVINSDSSKEDSNTLAPSTLNQEKNPGTSSFEDESSKNPSRIGTQDVDTSLVPIQNNKIFREFIQIKGDDDDYRIYKGEPGFEFFQFMEKVELEPTFLSR